MAGRTLLAGGGRRNRPVQPLFRQLALKPITIVGGGLAGLTLGIALRQQSVPVVIWELGQYPRHRVCGEFISGHGQETLRKLGLLELIAAAGARHALTAAFFSPTRGCTPHSLPQPALCLSRFKLDALLADKFRELGGDLRCRARSPHHASDEGVVRASGRRPQAEADAGGWHWFGVKAHARDLSLRADLELHTCRNGYVGLCRLRDGLVNICGLFRRRKGDPETLHGVPERLRGEPGTVLYELLSKAQFDPDSFCAVGGLQPAPRQEPDSNECCIGDSLTMIPPFTGNGMSMAFESAELATIPLAAFAQGTMGWETAREQVAARCSTAFARRLGWAGWLQRALLAAPLQAHLLPVVLKSRLCWKFFFWATR